MGGASPSHAICHLANHKSRADEMRIPICKYFTNGITSLWSSGNEQSCGLLALSICGRKGGDVGREGGSKEMDLLVHVVVRCNAMQCVLVLFGWLKVVVVVVVDMIPNDVCFLTLT